jgi:hypothetical protein
LNTIGRIAGARRFQMSDIVQELREKARVWQTEAAISSEDWRPMYQMLAWEYDRFAQEREDHSVKIPEMA